MEPKGRPDRFVGSTSASREAAEVSDGAVVAESCNLAARSLPPSPRCEQQVSDVIDLLQRSRRLWQRLRRPVEAFRLPPQIAAPVIVTCVNHGYAASGLLENWALSLARLGLQKHVLIAALDDAAASLAARLPGTTLRWNAADLRAPSRTALRFREKGWKPVVFSKVSLVRVLLEAGCPVLFSDADVVFLRDPRPWFPGEETADFAVQSDAPADAAGNAPDTLCSGLYYAHPTRDAIRTLRFTAADLRASRGEQEFLRRQLAVRRTARCLMLPRDLFPNGALWQQLPPNDPVAVHANWVVGVAEKIALLRRTGLWLPGRTS